MGWATGPLSRILWEICSPDGDPEKLCDWHESSGMMSRNLPGLIYPLDLARAKQSLSGHIPVRGMGRLQALLGEGNEGDVWVDLQFGSDERGHLGIQGTVRVDLGLVCQRCLETVPFCVESQVRLNIVSADDQETFQRITPGFEPVVAAEGEAMPLSDIVEDELLLALPMAPMHAEGMCGISDKYVSTGSPREERKNPFAALATGSLSG